MAEGAKRLFNRDALSVEVLRFAKGAPLRMTPKGKSAKKVRKPIALQSQKTERKNARHPSSSG
jgi:hypothetical protein